MVIGLNHATAGVAVRERFWISEDKREAALLHLFRSEGIEEVLLLVTCNRTEFLLWASDPSLAANSVLRFLSAEYSLQLCDWVHFYRLLDDLALLQIFRVLSDLDSMAIGEPRIIAQAQASLQQSRRLGTSGGYLDAVMQKALAVSERVRSEAEIGSMTATIPGAVVDLARQTIGSLARKRVLLIGAGNLGDLGARALSKEGAAPLIVVNRTLERARQLAANLGGTAVHFAELCPEIAEADIVISAASPGQAILSRHEAEAIMHKRRQRSLVMIDTAVPRSIDPEARKVPGLLLYDIDDLERVAKSRGEGLVPIFNEGLRIVAAEAQGFRHKLMAECAVPTMVALRQRLEQICRQELDSFKEECGPFSKDQDEILRTVTSRLTQKIAGSLARELKEVPEKVAQEQMTAAVERLFHLESPHSALAGANFLRH